MTGSTMLDVALLLVLIGQAARGWRRGALVGVTGLVGLVAGLWAGLWLAGRAASALGASQVGDTTMTLVRLGIVVLATQIGEGLCVLVGRRLRDATRVRLLRRVDEIVGAALSLGVAAVVMAVVASAVQPFLSPAQARAVASSRVLGTAQEVVPESVDRAATRAMGAIADGFPKVFSGLGVEPTLPAATPDDSATTTAAVRAAAASIVKVRATSTLCSRQSEGTGWVADTRRVVTNAHVVAGASTITVQVGGTGQALAATVVAYDPDLDLAVLRVPSLTATPLRTVSSVSSGQSVVVAGFPLDGPYTVGAARVRGTLEATGENIYATRSVTRSIISLRGTVEPGNSGGPLLTTDGRVAGTIFARSTTDGSTGYALANPQSLALIRQGDAATTPVSTQSCTAQ